MEDICHQTQRKVDEVIVKDLRLRRKFTDNSDAIRPESTARAKSRIKMMIAGFQGEGTQPNQEIQTVTSNITT
jgi:hypothetical protein